MIGVPVPGISTIGLGRSSVYGRSREPWPPARMTAWVTVGPSVAGVRGGAPVVMGRTIGRVGAAGAAGRVRAGGAGWPAVGGVRGGGRVVMGRAIGRVGDAGWGSA